MGTNFWWPERSLTFTPRPTDSAPPTRRVCLAVLPPCARGNSSLMRSVLMPARRLKGAQRGNQSGARSWVGRAPQLLSVSSQVAARPHNCHTSTPAVVKAETLYMFCFGDEEPLCKPKMRPSTDLATVFDFCSRYWECPPTKRAHLPAEIE